MNGAYRTGMSQAESVSKWGAWVKAYAILDVTIDITNSVHLGHTKVTKIFFL